MERNQITCHVCLSQTGSSLEVLFLHGTEINLYLFQTKSAMSVLRQTPSVEANFFKDRAFVDQRFAGANVWQIHRVTNSKGKSALRPVYTGDFSPFGGCEGVDYLMMLL